MPSTSGDVPAPSAVLTKPAVVRFGDVGYANQAPELYEAVAVSCSHAIPEPVAVSYLQLSSENQWL